MIYVYESELYHHGIKGQKWGVRRFQNADGSLTAEGYQHWGLNPDGSKFKGRVNRSDHYTEATTNAARKGAAIGAAVGIAAGGLAGGAMGATTLSAVGTMAGMTLGTVYGTVHTRHMQKKIRKLLDEKGTVYIKDL